MGIAPFLIAGIAAVAVLVIAVGIAMSAGGGGVSARLERYASPGRRTRTPADRKAPRSRWSSPACPRVIEKQDFTSRLAVDLARADLKMRPAEFLIICGA